ncbi:hypothetical protein RFI_22132, partial [Reticulomyxa filosa]
QYYQSQDKLASLFEDPEQSIDMCHIRLALLTQQQFQQQKDKMINNQEKEKSQDEKHDDYKEKNGKWINLLNYSLIYEIKLKISYCKIFGMTNRKNQKYVTLIFDEIAYLWGNGQMWNYQFQYLLHILLRKIIDVFHHINDNGDDQKKD